MSLLSTSRTVLIMGDEGLQIYHVKKRSVSRVAYLAWEEEGFERFAGEVIAKKCKGAPIVVLNDMVEQHYRKERIPKVSIIDQANVVKRRLSIAFPNYRVRAGLKLKDKSAPSSGDKKGNPYLFAAIPASDFFNKTLEAVNISMAPIIGFYLLPIEASAMARELSVKLAKGKSFKPMWTIFMGQHHNGGLRQIVTRNGELALTRLTPIVDTDVEPDLWAKEVSGELDATMSYLSRFGYKSTDGLDIIITANENCKQALEKTIQADGDLHLMNAQQISKLLGYSVGKQDDLRYADPVHAAYLGNKNKFLLPLQSIAISQLTQPRKIASYVMMALLAGCAYYGYTAFQNWTTSSDVSSQLVVQTQRTSAMNEEYNIELEKQKALGFDFRLVENSIDVYETLEKSRLKPLPIIREIGRVMGVDIRLDKLIFEKKTETAAVDPYSYGDEEAAKKEVLESILTISFPSSINPDISVRRVNDISKKLQGSLVGYEVEVIKQVADLSYTGNFSGESGTVSNATTPEKYQAEIRIRGDIK